MLLMIVGLAVFFAVHLLPTAPDLRQGLIDRFGEGPYKIVFSVLSLIGFVLIVVGFGKLQDMPGKNPDIWYPPYWLRHATMLLMLIAFIMLAAAYIPSRIRTVLKHPMLAGIKTWALAHLLVNGDLGSIVLFGSFLVWAVYDRISVRKREALGPLGARVGGLRGDVAAVVVGVVLYAAMLSWGHAVLIGVPLLPA
ncbi:MAG: NnrU family protein [Hyphomicrobiaceae bacterium]